MRRCILERDDEVAALREEAEEVAKAYREQVHALNTKLGDMEVQLMFTTDGDVSAISPKFSFHGPSIAQASPQKVPKSPARAALVPLRSNLMSASSKSVSKAAVKAPPSSAAPERGPVEGLVARALANKRRGDAVGGATPGAVRRTATERGPCTSAVEALVARALVAQGNPSD